MPRGRRKRRAASPAISTAPTKGNGHERPAAASTAVPRARRPRGRPPLSGRKPILFDALRKHLAGYETHAERLAFAEQAGTQLNYLYHLLRGYSGRKVTLDMAARIERASFGNVRCEELLPENELQLLQYLKWRPSKAERYIHKDAPAIDGNDNANNKK